MVSSFVLPLVLFKVLVSGAADSVQLHVRLARDHLDRSFHMHS